MRRKKIWTLALVACLGLAISGFADHKPGHEKPGGGGGGGGDRIPLTVTFRDLGGVWSVAEPDRIMSDCQMGDVDPDACPYIDGKDEVKAAIAKNFHMSLGQPGIRARELVLDFSDCVSAEEDCTPPLIGIFGGLPGPDNVRTDGPDLRKMGRDEMSSLSLRMGIDLTSIGGGVWTLFFDPSNTKCPGSSTVSVTRTGDDTWEIEAGPSPNALACLARLAKGNKFEFKGLYRMPFKITVQKK